MILTGITVFMEHLISAYCDVEKSDNLIIYGHNINGGKTFGALEQYKDKEFFKNIGR